MKHALNRQQHYDLYRKYHGQDSEISGLPGECGVKSGAVQKPPEGGALESGKTVAKPESRLSSNSALAVSIGADFFQPRAGAFSLSLRNARKRWDLISNGLALVGIECAKVLAHRWPDDRDFLKALID